MKKLMLPILALALLFSCKPKDSSSDKKDDDDKKERVEKKSADYRDLDEEVTDEDNDVEDNDVEEMSSGTSGKWGSAEEDSFMKSCVDGAKNSMGASKAESYCSCVLEKIEVKYPSAIDALKMDVNDMMEMAKDCVE